MSIKEERLRCDGNWYGAQEGLGMEITKEVLITQLKKITVCVSYVQF